MDQETKQTAEDQEVLITTIRSWVHILTPITILLCAITIIILTHSVNRMRKRLNDLSEPTRGVKILPMASGVRVVDQSPSLQENRNTDQSVADNFDIHEMLYSIHKNDREYERMMRESDTSPEIGLRLTVPEDFWVYVMNPDGIAHNLLEKKILFGANKVIQKDSTIEVVSHPEEGRLLLKLISEHSSGGTSAPTGTIFFASVANIVTMQKRLKYKNNDFKELKDYVTKALSK